MGLNVAEQITNLQQIVPTLKILTREINTPGDYLFFSHVVFDQSSYRYAFKIYLARKRLEIDLADITRVLDPLTERNSELFRLVRMQPLQKDKLFVVYEIALEVSEHYVLEDPWLS